MSLGKRKETIRKLNAAKRLCFQFDLLKEDAKAHLDDVAETIRQGLYKLRDSLDEEIKNAPVGHVYKGTYYLKRPDYQIKPGEERFIKEEGTIFINEDLITWNLGRGKGYSRAIYKEPDLKRPLKREDGVEVFSIPEGYY